MKMGPKEKVSGRGDAVRRGPTWMDVSNDLQGFRLLFSRIDQHSNKKPNIFKREKKGAYREIEQALSLIKIKWILPVDLIRRRRYYQSIAADFDF